MPAIRPVGPRQGADYPTVMSAELTWLFDPDLASGGSEETLSLHQAMDAVLVHYRAPVSRQQETVQQKFERLAAQWREETLFDSSVLRMSMHRAYQQIIGMGPLAVPLLLRELKRGPNHWFWALHAITGVDPVPQSDRGKVQAMAAAWLRWGEEQGFLR